MLFIGYKSLSWLMLTKNDKQRNITLESIKVVKDI